MHLSETSERLTSDSKYIIDYMLGKKEKIKKKREAAGPSPATVFENGDAHNDAGLRKKKPRHPQSAEKMAAKYGLFAISYTCFPVHRTSLWLLSSKIANV